MSNAAGITEVTATFHGTCGEVEIIEARARFLDGSERFLLNPAAPTLALGFGHLIDPLREVLRLQTFPQHGEINGTISKRSDGSIEIETDIEPEVETEID